MTNGYYIKGRIAGTQKYDLHTTICRIDDVEKLTTYELYQMILNHFIKTKQPRIPFTIVESMIDLDIQLLVSY